MICAEACKPHGGDHQVINPARWSTSQHGNLPSPRSSSVQAQARTSFTSRLRVPALIIDNHGMVAVEGDEAFGRMCRSSKNHEEPPG